MLYKLFYFLAEKNRKIEIGMFPLDMVVKKVKYCQTMKFFHFVRVVSVESFFFRYPLDNGYEINIDKKHRKTIKTLKAYKI